MNRFFVGTKIDGGETRVSYPMSPTNLAGAPGAFQGLHGVWVANSGELFYVACKLGRRPWRLSGLARCASSKMRVISGLACRASSKMRVILGLARRASSKMRVISGLARRASSKMRVISGFAHRASSKMRVISGFAHRASSKMRVILSLACRASSKTRICSPVSGKLGRRPWRLSGLARRAGSKTRVGLFPHVWSSSSPSSLTFSH